MLVGTKAVWLLYNMPAISLGRLGNLSERPYNTGIDSKEQEMITTLAIMFAPVILMGIAIVIAGEW
jgi:hypothetical protein